MGVALPAFMFDQQNQGAMLLLYMTVLIGAPAFCFFGGGLRRRGAPAGALAEAQKQLLEHFEAELGSESSASHDCDTPGKRSSSCCFSVSCSNVRPNTNARSTTGWPSSLEPGEIVTDSCYGANALAAAPCRPRGGSRQEEGRIQLGDSTHVISSLLH